MAGPCLFPQWILTTNPESGKVLPFTIYLWGHMSMRLSDQPQGPRQLSGLLSGRTREQFTHAAGASLVFSASEKTPLGWGQRVLPGAGPREETRLPRALLDAHSRQSWLLPASHRLFNCSDQMRDLDCLQVRFQLFTLPHF